MSSHSSILGGSTAKRLLECPGSYQSILALPPLPDTSSEFADEGTFAHCVMQALLLARMADNSTDMKAEARIWLGDSFFDRELTEQHLDQLIYPALDRLSELETLYGGGFAVAAVELKVQFPGVPGSFGTVDLVLTSPSHTLVVDWKFGAGVGVQAFTRNQHGAELLNAQLLFYICGALHTAPKLFVKTRHTGAERAKPTAMVVAIIQPRGELPLTHTTVYSEDIKHFVEDVAAAVSTALGRDPPLKRGDHCMWAPCKIACPLWVGPIKELAAFGPKPDPRLEAVSKMPTTYGEYLGHCKRLVDDLQIFATELDTQLHAYLEDGGYVPGYRLAPKKKQRAWVDEKTVADKLLRLGFTEAEIWQQKLTTFAAADAAAKRHGVKIPEELRVAPPSDETVVVSEDTPGPKLYRPVLTELLLESARKLNPRMG